MNSPRFVRALNPRVWILTVLVLLVASALLVVEGGLPPAQHPTDVPRDLAADQVFSGTPWTGDMGITQTVDEIMARAAREPKIPEGPPREKRREQSEEAKRPKRQNPEALPFADAASGPDAGKGAPQNPSFTFGSVSFGGPALSESGFIPPDSVGAVGPTQAMVLANGRFKVFDKTGVLGPLNVSDTGFWAPVLVAGEDVSDPHVRYDRLSGRWFITQITIPPSLASNAILVAVSSGATISGTGSFTLFRFQHDLVCPCPNSDTGGFADYDTLGVDKNALYIGVNEFNGGATSFLGTTGYVVRKSSVLGAGPIVVTAFRGLVSVGTGFAGAYTPQGVDNDDPAATEGYFIGVDGAVFSRLVMKRITTPGTTPGISGDLNLNVSPTTFPIEQAQPLFASLDSLDDRLFAAMVKKNKLTGISSLWTAHNIAVDTSGNASDAAGHRNGSRWYQIDNLTSTPVVTQFGTVFDNTVSNPAGYWIPSVGTNGQGHTALGASLAAAALTPRMVAVSRNASDAAGTMNAGGVVVNYAACTGYNVQGSLQRWGDYSQTVVDPNDDQSVWTFQEVCNNSNQWTVQAVRLQAPPPATPASATSASAGLGSVPIIVTGTSAGGSGFFDPGPDTGGPGFANHLTATISGSVVVNSVTRVDATHVSLSLNTNSGATPGLKNLTITNPDGQFVTVNNIINITSASPTTTLTRTPATLNFAGSKNGQLGAMGTVTPAQAVTVTFSGATPSWTAVADQSWVQITGGSGTGAGQFTVAIVNPGNIIGAKTSLTASIVISAPTATPVVVTVNLSVTQSLVAGASPFGQVDAPAQGAGGIQGAFGLSGWALDDRGVAFVKIYRNCLAPSEPMGNCVSGLIPGSPGTALVFIGDAAFVPGARPDLEAAFSTTPQQNRAGWGLLVLSNMLPRTSGGPFAQFGGQGPLTLYAIATDIDGQNTLLGRAWNIDHDPTNITMNNDTIAKPFGAIDTPTQGGNASGTLANFGWVITPDLNTIADGTDILMPIDGSTLVVFVDGMALGNVTYNQCRGNVGNPPPGGVFCNDDVASIFGNTTPQPPLTPRASNPTKFRNLDAGRGPQGSAAINTLVYANGLHSIAWSATDSNGRIEGIGSRNFIVLNGGAIAQPADVIQEIIDAPAKVRGAAKDLDRYPISKRPVSVRTGFDLRTVMKEMTRDAGSVRKVGIEPMGRVEIGFAAPVTSGHLVANGTLRDLPVGSTLVQKTGVFAWNPPPGYFGTYRLAFVINGEQVLVDVTVSPETSEPIKGNRNR